MMNRKILLITTVLLISNAGMALDIHLRKLQNSQITRTSAQKLSARIEAMLKERGLDEAVAKRLSLDVFATPEPLTLEMIHNITKVHNIVDEATLFEYVASEALHKKSIDLSEYSSLIGMVQKSQKGYIDAETLSKIKEVSQLNSALLST